MHTSLTIKRKVLLLLSNHASFSKNGKVKYENKTLYNLVLHDSAFEFEDNQLPSKLTVKFPYASYKIAVPVHWQLQ